MSDNLMEHVVSAANVERALRAVIRNQGAPGIDKMTTAQLESHAQRHWESIRERLLAGKWTPSPVRLVEIAKDGGGTRRLGIPTVVDRWIQTMLLGALEPLFEPNMSEHSYGFRPGRSQHDAVKAAQRYVQEGKSWVVDIDIKAFFDHVNHDILLHKLGQVIQDKRVLRLIGRYLRAGIMINGVVTEKRGRHAARQPAVTAAVEHLSGSAGPRISATQAVVLPVCRRLQHLCIEPSICRTRDGQPERVVEQRTAFASQCREKRDRSSMGTRLSGL